MRGVFVAVALVGTCRALGCDTCADGLCYTLYSGEDSPSEAEDRCEDRGGHLAKVITAGQVATVKEVLKNVPDGNCVRFGAILEAGSWRWTDGTAVTAIDVIENNGGEYCSCYWVEDDNVYDAPCHGGWGQGDYYLCATSEGSAGCDICDGRGVKADTVAGYECRTSAGENVGDSNAGPDVTFPVFNTEADCLAADPSNSWTAYTCENAAGFWAEDVDHWNLGWTCQGHQEWWDWGGEADGCCNSHAATFVAGPSGGDYDDAVAYCASIGGEIATIHSATENELARQACGGSSCWIGLEEVGGSASTPKESQTWRWMDGSTASYTNWLCSEPQNHNGRDERNAMMNCCGTDGVDASGMWYDAPDDYGDPKPLCRTDDLNCAAPSTGACLEGGGVDNDCCAICGNGGCAAGYNYAGQIAIDSWTLSSTYPDFYPTCGDIYCGNTCCVPCSDASGSDADVTCSLVINDKITAVYVDGQDVTGSLCGDWPATLKFSSAASLFAISGYDNQGGCQYGGFAMRCITADGTGPWHGLTADTQNWRATNWVVGSSWTQLGFDDSAWQTPSLSGEPEYGTDLVGGSDTICVEGDFYFRREVHHPTSSPTYRPTDRPTDRPTLAAGSGSPSFRVTGDLTFEGMTYEAASLRSGVFVAAVADLCGVAASAVTVEISEARRRRLAEGIVVTYTVGVATANEAQTVTSAISSSSTVDVDAAISKAATNAGLDDDFDGVTTTNVGTPTTTASGDDESPDGNGGADAASAGFIALYVVVGVAALAGIAFGAYWFMRAKGGAAEPPMVEVQEMAPAPVPRKDQIYAAAVPVASAPPTMPPPPPEPVQERPFMLSRLASWRAPAAEAPTGRNLFCTACGAPVQGPFCGGCGLRAA